MKPGLIMFIVEGKSEEAAFGAIFERLFPRDLRPVFAEERSDYLTADSAQPERLVKRLEDLLYDSARRNHFRLEDVVGVVQLADTDGCYVPDSSVIQDDKAGRIRYDKRRIVTHDKKGIEKRNAQKSRNLDRLAGTEELLGIPFVAYYLSCNLDHVLTDVRNLPSKDKVRSAMAFAKKYWRQPERFVEFIGDPVVAAPGGYEDSWAFIREGLHSLARWSNLHLLFENARGYSGEETTVEETIRLVFGLTIAEDREEA